MIKSKINRFTAMLLSVLMILSSFSILIVNAAKETIHIESKSTGIKWTKSVSFHDPYSDTDLTYAQGQDAILLRVKETGEKAYSLQPGANLVDPEDGSAPALSNEFTGAWDKLSEEQQNSVKIAMNLASSIDTESSEDEIEIATQLLIWEFICGYRNPVSAGKDFDMASEPYRLIDSRFAVAMFGNNYEDGNVKNPGVFDAYVKFEEQLREFFVAPSYASTIKGMSSYQLTWDEDASTYSIQLPDSQEVTKNCIFSCDNKYITFKRQPDSLTITSKTAITEPTEVRISGMIAGEKTVNVYGSENKTFQSVITKIDDTKVTESYLMLLPEDTNSLKVSTMYQNGPFVYETYNKNVEDAVLKNTEYVITNASGYYVDAVDNGDGTYTYSSSTKESKGTRFVPSEIDGEYAFFVNLPLGDYRIQCYDNMTGYREVGQTEESPIVKIDGTSQSGITFIKDPHQLMVGKRFVKYNAATIEDFQKVTLKIKQTDTYTNESKYIKVMPLSDRRNWNAYQYVIDENDDIYKDQTITEVLTFHNGYNTINILGLPRANARGNVYKYNVEEVGGNEDYHTRYYDGNYYSGIEYTSEGSPNSSKISASFAYLDNGFWIPVETASLYVSNIEKKQAAVDIDINFKVNEIVGEYSDFTGEEGLTLEEAYDGVSVNLRYVEGSAFDMYAEDAIYYVMAEFDSENNCYVYNGATKDQNQATDFKVSDITKKAFTIKELPSGKYNVSIQKNTKIQEHYFKADASVRKVAILNGQENTVSFDLIKQNFSSFNISTDFVDGVLPSDVQKNIEQYIRFTAKDKDGNAVNVVCENAEYGIYRIAKDGDTNTVSEMKLGTSNGRIFLKGPDPEQDFTITQSFTEDIFGDIPDMKVSEVFACDTLVNTASNITATPDSMSITGRVPETNQSRELSFSYGFRKGQLTIHKTTDLGLVAGTYTVKNGIDTVTTIAATTKTDNNTVTSISTQLPVVEYNFQTAKFQKINYIIEESNTNESFGGEKTKKTLMIPDKETVVEFTNNVNYGDVELTLTGKNEITGETQPLANVRVLCKNIFYPYNKQTATTDTNGVVHFENLPLADIQDGSVVYAQYELSQTYSTDSEPYETMPNISAVFKNLQYKEEVINKMKMGRIYLTLRSSSYNALSDAVFSLFNDVNNNNRYDEGIDTPATGWSKDGDEYKAVQTLQETNIGKYTMDAVPAGSYILVETKYPDGYYYGAITAAFKISKDGDVVHPYNRTDAGSSVIIGNGSEDRQGSEFTPISGPGEYIAEAPSTYDIYNRGISGTISFFKVDSKTHEKLTGASFKVYRDADGDRVLNTEVDQFKDYIEAYVDGEYSQTFEYGTYFIVEDVAPAEYQKSDKVYIADIHEDNAKVELNGGEIPNDIIAGGITVFKIDTITREKLAGAEFTVYTDVDEDGAITNVDTVFGKTQYDTSAQKYYLNDIPYGYYILKETKAPEGHHMSDAVYPFCIMDNGANITITDKNAMGVQNMPIQAYVKISKVDSTDENKKLSDAEFTLYDKSGKAIATAVSDKNGIADFGKVYYGSYTVRETRAPIGYILDGTPFTIKVIEENKTYIHTHPNAPSEGTCIIKKTSEDNIVSGIKFNISGTTDMGTNIDQTVITNDNGQIITNLPAGTYTVKELEVAERYVTPVDRTITIQAGQETILDFQNTLKHIEVNDKGAVEIIKTADDNVVSGIEFKISGMATNGAAVEYNVITDATGKAVINDVPVGTYKVEEITTADRYITQLDQQVAVKADTTSTVKFFNTTKKASVQIVKVDAENPEIKLSGAEFTIYDTEGHEVGVMAESDVKGVYIYDNLAYGEYTVKETKAPDGYVLDTDSYPLSVTEDGQTITVENIEGTGFGNTLEKGSIAIHKTSYDGKVAGFSFQIIGNNYDQTFVTDDSGDILAVDLIPGEYTVSEVLDELSAQYLIPENITVTVKNNEVTEVNRFNDEKEQQEEPTVWFEISKVDAISKEPIAGCQFAIKDTSGVVLTTIVTDETGKARVQMPYGEYLYQEVEAPEGYIVDSQDYEFTISGQEDFVQAIVSNVGTGNIKVIKQDEATEDTLQNCEIALLDKDKKVIFTGVTDENGEVLFEDLAYGLYYYQETKAPNGYILDETLYEVEVTENGATIVAILTNKQKPLPEPEDKPDPEPIPENNPVPEDRVPDPEPKDVPKTSDNTNILAILLVGLVSAATVVILNRKSKKAD